MIATSWSDNPNKGSDVLAWLDANLDHDRYELTFAGRTAEAFEHVRVLGALPTEALADGASPQRRVPRAEPQRPVLERPAGGARLRPAGRLPRERRPSRARRRGAGCPFDTPEEVPAALDRLVAELDERRAAIHVAPLADVADRYLEVLRIDASA